MRRRRPGIAGRVLADQLAPVLLRISWNMRISAGGGFSRTQQNWLAPTTTCRSVWVNIWITCGDTIREEVNDGAGHAVPRQVNWPILFVFSAWAARPAAPAMSAMAELLS